MGGVEEAVYLKFTDPDPGVVPSSYKYARIENCLFTDITDGYPTYIEPHDKYDATTVEWPEVIIDHVTVDRCIYGLTVYGVSGALIQNCVVTNMLEDPQGTNYAIRAEPGRFAGAPASTVKNCIYSHGTLDLGNEFVDNVIENVDSVAAIFVDAESGNYALAEGSPGIGAGTDGKDLGFLGPYPVVPQLPVVADLTTTSYDCSNLCKV